MQAQAQPLALGLMQTHTQGQAQAQARAQAQAQAQAQTADGLWASGKFTYRLAYASTCRWLPTVDQRLECI